MANENSHITRREMIRVAGAFAVSGLGNISGLTNELNNDAPERYPVPPRFNRWLIVPTVEQLRHVRRKEAIIYVEGHSLPGDGGGGLFRYDESLALPDDNGIVIRPDSRTGNGRWIRIRENNNIVHVAWFGLKGDGVTDDHGAIQSALDACPANGKVILTQPQHHYRTTATLSIKKSMQFMGSGIIPPIIQDGQTEPVITVAAPASSIVIIDNFHLIGGSKGIDLTGGRLTRHSRFRNLDIHGCSKVGIDIRTGMIGAQFENVQIRSSPDYGIRCLNTTHIISVRFVTCRIGTTDVAAGHFEHPHASSHHAISFVSPIIEGNRGTGLVFRGGYQISIYDAHFENNGINTGGADVDLGSNEHLRAICNVQFIRGSFSAPSVAQINNNHERIFFSTHHVNLIMNGTNINASHVVNANNQATRVQMAFMNVQTYPIVANYPGVSIVKSRFGIVEADGGIVSSGISSNAGGLQNPYALNLRGSVTVSGLESSGTAIFDFKEPDTNYFVNITPSERSGNPQSGSNRVQWTEKTQDGFTIILENAPGVGNSVTFDWFLLR